MRQQGVASALDDVTREFGTALGVALLGALLGALLASGYRRAIDGRLSGVAEGPADTAREGVARAIQAAGGAFRGPEHRTFAAAETVAA